MTSKKPEENKVQEFKSKDGRVLAMLFKHGLEAQGVRFLTPENFPLQLGILDHPQGKNVPMHLHEELKATVKAVHEVLYVEKGRAHIELADESWEPIGKTTIEAGDMFLICGAAHAVNIEKGSRIIEVKHGPYTGPDYAKIFKS